MDLINNSKYSIILGSGSTRRKELLEMTGISFQVNSIPVNEDFPKHLKAKEIAKHIVENKAAPFQKIVENNQIIILADTLVWFEDECWGKPKDKNEAKSMLKMFAGNSHDVITSVGFLTKKNFEIITETTKVTYKLLTEKEIDFYVETINPISFSGCLFRAFSILVSELRNFSDIGVLRIEGAIAFTLIFGANSAASDLVKPSIAPFEAETEL